MPTIRSLWPSAVFLTFLGCDQIDIRPATANDCKKMYTHSLDVYCGDGLLASACKAALSGLGALSEAEDDFIKSCVAHATKKDVACALKQQTKVGVEMCLETFSEKVNASQ